MDSIYLFVSIKIVPNVWDDFNWKKYTLFIFCVNFWVEKMLIFVVWFYVMQPYNSSDMVTASKNSYFILYSKMGFLYSRIFDNLSVKAHVLTLHEIRLYSVDGILQPRYLNWFTNFKACHLM